ncbi:uncharacterized protein LOC121655971 [Melanotaenia boesemani]|uniref:uncharacterized protein LOC121655971 n=1 Tax=Melanotaenia boesemani TaxID=1250792 RepID=UPI001C03FC2A|nr:uncharacterized protein LOC121655971 [Melanotaenia boesemani]
MWNNIRVCLPITLLVIALCCLVRMDFVPVYYINLLISNLIQLCANILWVAKWDEDDWLEFVAVIYCCGGMASIGFRMCITLERYFSISRPQLQWIRQTTDSLLLSFLIWMFFISIVRILVILKKMSPLVIMGLLFGPVFLTCLIRTLKALPAATSTPAEEKRRIVGTLILLLLNYNLFIIPTVILHILIMTSFNLALVKQVCFTLILLSPFMDLTVFVLMCKGPTNKGCLRCGQTENTAADHLCE